MKGGKKGNPVHCIPNHQKKRHIRGCEIIQWVDTVDPTIISLLKVWSITYKLYTAQAKNFIHVLSGHPLERTHNLHTDQGETPTLTSLLLKRKVAMNSYCSRALTSLSPYENRMTTVSLFAFNTCVLRYLAAGFYSASKTAHLVQGTQVSSDAGHNNVH